jgi:zinc protease
MPLDSRSGLRPKAEEDRLSLPAPDVARRELDNGLTILVRPDFTAPVVSIQFWIGTGSLHEGRWLGAGMSHLLEHLMFKGTPTRGNSQLAQQIHDLGGHLNAYTSFDRTVYHVDLPCDHWRPALDILADAVFNSTLPAEEYAKEMEVIRREFAMGRDNPDSELGKLIFQTAFTRHPYRHPVIGHLDLFNQLTREDVLAYYHERYVPQNQTLIVVGAVDPAEIFAEAERLLEKYPRRPMGEVFLPEEPPAAGPRRERREFATQLSRLALAFPIGGLEHPDIPALDLLSILAGGGVSSRLNQSCVEKKALAEHIEAFCYAPNGYGLWGVEARFAPENEEALVAEVRAIIAGFRDTEVKADELERAKRQSLLHHLHSQKTMSGKASSIGRGWLFRRDPGFSTRYHARVQEVTPVEIQAAARRYFLPEREIEVVLAPKQARTVQTQPATPLAEPARPELIALGGARRAIYVPQHQLPLVSFRAVMTGGLLREPEEKAGLSRLAASLLVKGTQRRSAEQLARDVEQLGGSLHADSGNNSCALSLDLLSADAAPGLDILIEVLTETALSETELQTEKRKQLSQLQAEEDYPMAVARNLIREALYPGHPYGRRNLGTTESVTALTLKDVAAYQHAQMLTQEMVFAVSGPVPSAEWRGQVETGLTALAPSKPRPALTLPTLKGVVRCEKIVPKEQAVIHLAFPTVPVVHPDQIGLTLLDETLSDLGSRLFVRIREELGLAYFVGTSQFLGLDAGHFFFYVGTDPAKRQEIEQVLLDEVAQLAAHGITEIELNRARAKVESQEKLERQNPSHLAYTAALDELFGLGFDYAQERRRRTAAITLAEVNALAARYFSSPNYALAVVAPK